MYGAFNGIEILRSGSAETRRSFFAARKWTMRELWRFRRSRNTKGTAVHSLPILEHPTRDAQVNNRPFENLMHCPLGQVSRPLHLLEIYLETNLSASQKKVQKTGQAGHDSLQTSALNPYCGTCTCTRLASLVLGHQHVRSEGAASAVTSALLSDC